MAREFVIKIAFRGLFVACRDISMVAVARVENIGLGARLGIWAGLPRAIAYVGPRNGRVDEAPS